MMMRTLNRQWGRPRQQPWAEFADTARMIWNRRVEKTIAGGWE
jgi:hypothetical protein